MKFLAGLAALTAFAAAAPHRRGACALVGVDCIVDVGVEAGLPGICIHGGVGDTLTCQPKKEKRNVCNSVNADCVVDVGLGVTLPGICHLDVVTGDFICKADPKKRND